MSVALDCRYALRVVRKKLELAFEGSDCGIKARRRGSVGEYGGVWPESGVRRSVLCSSFRQQHVFSRSQQVFTTHLLYKKNFTNVVPSLRFANITPQHAILLFHTKHVLSRLLSRVTIRLLLSIGIWQFGIHII